MSVNAIPHSDHEWNYHTNTKWFPYYLPQGKGDFLDFCTVAMWMKLSAVVTPCDQAPQLHRHLQTQMFAISTGNLTF